MRLRCLISVWEILLGFKKTLKSGNRQDQLAIIVSTLTAEANDQDNLHYYKTVSNRQGVEALALRVRDDLDQATSSQELAIAKLQKLYELLIRLSVAIAILLVGLRADWQLGCSSMRLSISY